MNTVNLRMLIAAAAVSVVALGPAAGLAFAEKPKAGPPDRAEASRFARGEAREQDRGRGNDARQQDRGRPDARRGDDRGRDAGPTRYARGDDRGRGNEPRHDDRGGSRGGDERYDDRRGGDRDRYSGDDRRYDSRGHESAHYVRPVYRPVQHRPPPYKHYTYFDTRYNHRHYYPPRGYYYPYAPPGLVPVYYNRYRYYYGGGIWYAPRGLGFAVVAPPLGIFVSLLPPYYSTVWFGGIPYYYANDVYYLYRERDRVYEVVEPPYGIQATTVSPAAAEVYVYPRQGQSQEQTDFDRYECHRWAADETGFDPTRPIGGVGADQARAARGEYLRAMTACLEGRGYSVR